MKKAKFIILKIKKIFFFLKKSKRRETKKFHVKILKNKGQGLSFKILNLWKKIKIK